MKIQPVLLCGGSGTRLWPLSREQYPKQLLALNGDRTLLQATALRAMGLTGEVAAPIVVCNEEHSFLVAEQLREIDVRARAIMLEPVGRGTAPALTLAALNAAGEDPVLLVMPSDHVIAAEPAFCAALGVGAALAAEGFVVTFGVPPVAAETGYGYIRTGAKIAASAEPAAYQVHSFVEKPDTANAKRYCASGRYLWNSGIFAVRASVWLESITRYRPEIAAACERAQALGTWDSDFFRVDRKCFAECASDSIDYAVMERLEPAPASAAAPRAAVVRMEAGWSDVGAWSALWEIGSKDDSGNVLHGDVCAVDTRNSLLIGQSRLIACVGLDDIVVIETPDAVMVARKDKAQDVKEVVTRLKEAGRKECLNHRKVYRPWGSYDGIDSGQRFQVKRIIVKPGAALSLQMHHHRAEHWVVVRGTARITRGDEVFLLTENQSTYIPLGVRHRLENPGKVALEIIEVQSGAYLGEDDIVRFDDAYGRTEKSRPIGWAPPADAALRPPRPSMDGSAGGEQGVIAEVRN
ncbi:MAG TPA: mannose-1-phosphate guanylyltransferase/mannose-6-phosphate isomerase [Burkholderiales bacterium]|nr:mannose-1-phosphate guanylyltransferase/mannose-6-phosphate isomerase [Burkholderiales bacterium]